MIDRIRIGVIGTSWWPDMWHLPMFKADPRVEIVAICGRNRERAQEMATKYDIPTVFTDYRDMLTNGDLQAIVIGTPDDEHYAMTMAALDAGLHVLCEKPLALNATDAKAMFEKAQAKGVRHMAFFSFRWMPLYRYMHELIEQGVLGRLYSAQFSFLMGSARNPDYQWRFDRQRAHGVIGDLGSHMFDLARYLVGDIARVNAQLASDIRRKGVDGRLTDSASDSASDSATALIEFINGAHGHVHISMVARVSDPVLEQQVTLHGETGSLIGSLKFMGSQEVRLARGDEGFQTLTIPDSYMKGVDASQPTATQLLPMFTQHPVGGRLFVDAILANQVIDPGFDAGWKSQQVIDAAIASHESGQWVAV